MVITLDDALAGLPGSGVFHRFPPEIGDLWENAGPGGISSFYGLFFDGQNREISSIKANPGLMVTPSRLGIVKIGPSKTSRFDVYVFAIRDCQISRTRAIPLRAILQRESRSAREVRLQLISEQEQFLFVQMPHGPALCGRRSDT